MAETSDLTSAFADPTALLDAREAVAVRNMMALINIVESPGDLKARVSAAVELNRMLSIGALNRPLSPTFNRQTNNLQLTPSQADAATTRLLERLTPRTELDPDLETDARESLAVINDAIEGGIS